MKKILVIFTLLLTVSCSEKEADYKQIVFRKDIAYEINSNTPFTGTRLDYCDNGQAKTIETYKNGIKDGPFESRMCNGRLRDRTIYKNGEIVVMEFYYVNGNLFYRSEYDFKSGEMFLDETYWESGKPMSRTEIDIKSGEITEYFYDEEGNLLEI